MVIFKRIGTAARKHLRHPLAAIRYSVAGLKTAYRDEIAFRQIVFCAIVGIPLAFLVAGNWTERMILILPLGLALVVELLNTAVESAIDRISPEFHPISKKAKDTGSAAQFCAQLLAALVWASYAWMRIFG